MMKIAYILPILARGRDAVEEAYGRIVQAARKDTIPCSLLDAYRNIRGRQMAAETRVIDAARQAGVQAPEDAPRSIATFGACTPGEDNADVDKKSLAVADKYLSDVLKRAKLSDTAYAKAYTKLPTVRQIVNPLLNELSRFARTGTDEVLQAPQNISLLRLIYYCGGTPWQILEGEKLRQIDIEFDLPAALETLREANYLAKTAQELGEARGVSPTGEPEKKSIWPWVFGGVGIAAPIGLSLLVWKMSKNEESEREERSSMMMHPEAFAEERVVRRRRKRRKIIETPEMDELPEMLDDEEMPLVAGG